MNANPAFAASVAPALDASDARAPESTRDRDRARAQDRAGLTTLETFDVYRVSLDACRASAPIAPSLSAILRDQLLRASSSVVLNIAEGFGSSSRGVKRRHYEIARGSAMECVAILDLASARGIEGVPARALFTRATMMLSKLEARFRLAVRHSGRRRLRDPEAEPLPVTTDGIGFGFGIGFGAAFTAKPNEPTSCYHSRDGRA